jgi:F1F0 ATPase subunit 2
MNEILSLAAAVAAGALLGAVFFGGLWWTVRKAFRPHSRRVGREIVISTSFYERPAPSR